jgi:hypothetical protein
VARRKALRPAHRVDDGEPHRGDHAGRLIDPIAISEKSIGQGVNGQPFEGRQFCRNPRCRSKLAIPIGNPREAFCCRGCHASFYRNRCLICECAIERKTERQLICGKRRCRNALQARIGLGR